MKSVRSNTSLIAIVLVSGLLLHPATNVQAQVENTLPSPQTPPSEPQVPATPLDPLTLPLEPAPLSDQQNLFPTEPQPRLVRPSARIDSARAEELPINVRQSSQTLIESPESNTAASNFGYDPLGTGISGPATVSSQADRERDRLIARAERQATLQHYNIKIGPIPFRFGAGIDVQITDNVGTSDRNKQADLIVIPHFDIYGALQITSHNTLSIQFSLGYLWDMNREDQSRTLTNASLGLDSDAGISFDIKIGNFRINIHERPSIPRQQFDLITQRAPVQYAQFVNVAGVSVFWDMNSRVSASFRYDHFNSISLKSDVESLDQATEQFGASADFRANDSLTIGIQANGSIVKYDQEFLNDATNYSVGLSASLKASKAISIRGTMGYQVGRFGSSGETGDLSSTNDWYASVEIYHNINSYLSQSISIGRESQLGTASNSTEVTYLRHRLSLAIFQNAGLGTNLSIESAKESGGQFAQDIKLYQLGIFSYFSLSKRMTLSLQYRFLKRTSDTATASPLGNLGYVENRLDMGLQYQF